MTHEEQPDWESQEREAWRDSHLLGNAFESDWKAFDIQDDIADYWISRMREMREQVMLSALQNMKDACAIAEMDARAEAVEEIRKMINEKIKSFDGYYFYSPESLAEAAQTGADYITLEILSSIPTNDKTEPMDDYETHHSHSHCWQEQKPPCGLPHTAEDTSCCLCRLRKNWKKIISDKKQSNEN